ncbi:MAG: hypothetical protein AAGI91_15235 [Bacteroidota bacterium]
MTSPIQHLIIHSNSAVRRLVLALYAGVTLCMVVVHYFLVRLYWIPTVDASFRNVAESIGFSGIQGFLLVAATVGAALALFAWSVATYGILSSLVRKGGRRNDLSVSG